VSTKNNGSNDFAKLSELEFWAIGLDFQPFVRTGEEIQHVAEREAIARQARAWLGDKPDNLTQDVIKNAVAVSKRVAELDPTYALCDDYMDAGRVIRYAQGVVRSQLKNEALVKAGKKPEPRTWRVMEDAELATKVEAGIAAILS